MEGKLNMMETFNFKLISRSRIFGPGQDFPAKAVEGAPATNVK